MHKLVQCAYCDARLQAEPEAIAEDSSLPPRHDFPSVLSQARHGRFEMSWLHQAVTRPELDTLHFQEIDADRAALIYLRRTDKDGRSQPGPLPLEPLTESLQAYGDPGLAAHTALEWLCNQPTGFTHALEVAILLLDSRHSTARIYTAGCPRSLYWLSGEDAGITDLAGYVPALERRMLFEARDYFSGQPQVQLAAFDSLVLVSAAFAGRGDGVYADGTGALVQGLREQLGEDPLRLVTLAKNAFWEQRAPAARDEVPHNSLNVVAVQARPAQPVAEWKPPLLQELGSPAFSLACWSGGEDFLELLPLHNDRSVLVWASNAGLPWSDEAAATLRSAIRDVLDRPDHGDNENPRLAVRQARAAVPCTALLVVQMLDSYVRVKYGRYGLPHPIYLGNRGWSRGDGIMAFDEGGEVSLEPGGGRLVFLNAAMPQGPLRADGLAAAWPGGKASNLYWTLAKLWTTPPTGKALDRLLQAAAGDGVRLHPGTVLLTAR